jgi:hypothetical protein
VLLNVLRTTFLISQIRIHSRPIGFQVRGIFVSIQFRISYLPVCYLRRLISRIVQYRRETPNDSFLSLNERM